MENVTEFIKYPQILMSADGYISLTTGKPVELSANEKNVYVVMAKRNSFFRDQGKSHFDKQEDIAEICRISLKQVGRILRSFIENGLITAHKGNSKEHKNWRYEKVHEIKLYRTTKIVDDDHQFEMIGSVPESFWRTSTKKVEENYVAKDKPSNSNDWFDEESLPF